MATSTIFEPKELINKGLNLNHVFEINQLPSSILAILEKENKDLHKFNQLILIAHGGKTLWNSIPQKLLSTSKEQSSNPIDNFTTDSINTWFEQNHSEIKKKIIYPPSQSIPLQTLGQLAHYHFTSPFLVGINNLYGSWFAYRALVLSKSNFTNPEKEKTHSPCVTCRSKICISKCPAQACDETAFNMKACLNYRLKEHSLCEHTCQARVSCPESTEHKYSTEQIQYHYQRSLNMIKSVK